MKTLSFHAQERISERGISNSKIYETIEFGKMFYRQGMLFFVNKDDRHIVVTSNPKDKEVLVVITTYARRNAMKYVKLKSKRLYKNQAA